MPDASTEAALTAARDLLGGTETETEAVVEGEVEETSEQPEEAPVAEAEEAQHETAPELPDEIRELLETPDFDAEAEDALRDELETTETEDEVEEWEEDPKVLELKKQLIKEQKKSAWFEKLRAESERKKWEDEASKYFPYADQTQIQSTSRRGFLRAAKAQHDAIKDKVDAALLGDRKRLDDEREAMREEIRKEVEAAWGKVTTGPGVPPADAAEKAEQTDEAFKKSFVAGVREMI